MKELYLLDCTLRDGGYVNNWRFGMSTIRSIIRRLDAAGVDIIECGFLDSRVNYDRDCSIYPDIPSVSKTLGSLVPRNAMIVAMIDFGTFDDSLLIPKSESVLDGIRLIFKKENADSALEQAKKIKKLGYKLFINPVALTSYRPTELLELVAKINRVQPSGMSIVDTYGLMFDNDVEQTVVLIDNALDRCIALGYHCHNNLEMASAHCITYINKNLRRDKVVDTSILGMGKNAGNARTEIVSSYLAKQEIKPLDLDYILDCAYTDILKFQNNDSWGYSLNHFLSAINDCSPNWIKFLMNKNTLSVRGINKILGALPFEKREVSYFNKDLAEQKYLEYMNKQVDDSVAVNSLKIELNGNSILLLCPGRTLQTNCSDIEKYISEHKPIVISVNFITDKFPTNYAFISNTNRYSLMLGLSPDFDVVPTLILTSNIIPDDALQPQYTLNYKTLYESMQGDNGAGLLISFLKSIRVGNIAIAGMDGFDENGIDKSFFDSGMALGLSHNANISLVEQLHRVIDCTIQIEWITPSSIKDALFDRRVI